MEDESKFAKLFRTKKKEKKVKLTKEERDLRTKQWTTFYRRNWNIYAKQELGIPLYFFQEILLYLLGISVIFFEMCSRGLTKSFIAGVGAVVQAMLYPNSEIVLTSQTMKTAKKLVQEKIENELCKKLSPKLKYLYEHKQITFEYNQEEIRVRFLFNNSWILILPEADSSLGSRACMVIFEETRIMKKYFVDSVFRPMLRPRQATYLSLPQYQNKNGKPLPELLEQGKTVYLTSTKYKYMWFWDRWKKTVENTFNNKKAQYNFFCGDIFTAIEHGIKTEVDLMTYKQDMSEIELRMEIFNEPIGEVEDAFYDMKSFKDNCVLYEAFTPPTTDDILCMNTSRLNNRPKQEGEIRILFIDFAFKDTTKKGQENDLTVIGCMSGRLNDSGDKLIRDVDYMVTLTGSNTETAKLKIRELFFDYQADYIIPDFRNGGELIFRDDLSKPFHHPERHKGSSPTDIDYEEWHGFTICNDANLKLLSDADLDNFRKYVVDINAIPCVIPFKGGLDINDKCHTTMKSALLDEKIRFLVDESDLENKYDEKLLMMESEDKVLFKLPFIETNRLIEEAVNLSKRYKDGRIILEEPRTGTKDRIVACEYGNYIMSLLENRMASKQTQGDFNINDWSFLANL